MKSSQDPTLSAILAGFSSTGTAKPVSSKLMAETVADRF